MGSDKTSLPWRIKAANHTKGGASFTLAIEQEQLSWIASASRRTHLWKRPYGLRRRPL